MPHHVVIIGGGFAGLNVAKSLRSADVRVTLIDRANFHLFQPLLYQVATGSLSPANIAIPLRRVLRRQRNVTTLMAEVLSIDPHRKTVCLRDREINYDTLVVATGARHHYFGNDHYEEFAPGLKTISDATRIRARILSAFEAAERSASDEDLTELLTFVVVGAGPTGLELAGAIADLARNTLHQEYRHINTATARVLLLEGQDKLLPSYPEKLSRKAVEQIERLGVTVRTSTLVRQIDTDSVVVETRSPGEESTVHETIRTSNVFWAAGVKASPLGQTLAAATGAELDRMGRVMVEPDCSLAGFPDVFVLGDLAHFADPSGDPLPGTAAVAKQQGKHTARQIKRRLRGHSTKPFRYRDLGQMATIGRSAAVCDLGPFEFSGWLAWQAWLFLHLVLLIGFQNRLLVLMQWAFYYFTSARPARLITQRTPAIDDLESPSISASVEGREPNHVPQ